MNTRVRTHGARSKPEAEDQGTGSTPHEGEATQPSGPAIIEATSHPIANRLRGLLIKRSARDLSKAAGLSDAHISLLIRRLDQNPNADVEVGTLLAIAQTADVSFSWLATGRDDTKGQRLCDLGPQWDEMAEEVAHDFPTLPAFAIKAAGRLVLPELPERTDVWFLAQLARAWADANPHRVREEQDAGSGSDEEILNSRI